MSLQGVEPPQGIIERALNSGGGFPRVQLIPPQGLGVAGAVPVPPDWFDTDWQCRIPITVQSGQVVPIGGQTDFPFTFNSINSKFSKAQANGADFRFVLPNKDILEDYQIETFDTGINRLTSHVKVPLIFDGKIIYLYFNNPTAVDQQKPTLVWTDYENVLHMNQVPVGAGSIKDSTINGNDATPVNAVAQDLNSKIGRGLTFTRSLQTDINHSAPQKQSITVTIWARSFDGTTTWNDTGFMYSLRGNNGWIIHPVSGSALVQFFIADNLGVFGTVVGAVNAGGANLDKFHQYGFRIDATTGQISVIIDGVVSDVVPTRTRDVNPATLTATIGFDAFPTSSRHGSMHADESRISSLALSNDRIKTEFNNQNAPETFYNIGPVTCIGVVPDPLMLYENDIQMIYESGIEMQYE